MNDEMVSDLEDYAVVEGSKLGNMCLELTSLYWHYRHQTNDNFKNALREEIEKQLDNFKKNCKIVKREKTVTRTIRELEWNKEKSND